MNAQQYYRRIYSMAPASLKEWMRDHRWHLIDGMHMEIEGRPLTGGKWRRVLPIFLPSPDFDTRFHDAAEWDALVAWLDKYAPDEDTAMVMLSAYEEQPVMRTEAGLRGSGMDLEGLAAYLQLSPVGGLPTPTEPVPHPHVERVWHSGTGRTWEITPEGKAAAALVVFPDAPSAERAASALDLMTLVHGYGARGTRKFSMSSANQTMLSELGRAGLVRITDRTKPGTSSLEPWVYLTGKGDAAVRLYHREKARIFKEGYAAATGQATEKAGGVIAREKPAPRKPKAPPIARERPIDVPTVGPHTKGRNPICRTTSPLYDSAGREYLVQYKVVPASIDGTGPVRASNLPGSFARTPDYPEAFQARSLSSVEESHKIKKMAQGLEPDRLVWAALDPTIGAPVVWHNPTDGAFDVLGGNGRTLAILMAPPARYEAYKAAVKENWPGLWPAQLGAGERGILVRVTTWPDGRDLSEAEAVNLAGASQESTAAPESPLGRALSTLRSLGLSDPSALPAFQWSSVVSANNVGEFQRANPMFWSAISDRLDPAKRATYNQIDQAAQLIRQVMVGYLPDEVRREGFGDEATEETLLAALPMMVSLELLIRDGAVKPKWSLLRQLPDAVNLYRMAQRKRISLRKLPGLLEAEAMQAALSDTLLSGITMLAFYLGVAIYKASRLKDPTGSMAAYLAPYYTAAVGDTPGQGGMFGAAQEADPAATLAAALGLRLPDRLPPGMKRNPAGRLRPLVHLVSQGKVVSFGDYSVGPYRTALGREGFAVSFKGQTQSFQTAADAVRRFAGLVGRQGVHSALGPHIFPVGSTLDFGARLQNPRRNWGTLLDEYNLEVYGVPHDLANKVASRLVQGIKTAADLCRIDPPVCKTNLGIPRSSMPQLGHVKDEFLGDLQSEGVTIKQVAIPAGELKATQRDIQALKAHKMAESMMKGVWDPAKADVLVSADGYILDGHHRWAALVLAAPHRGMLATRIGLPIRELLLRSMQQPGVKRFDLEGNEVPVSAPLEWAA